MNKRLGRALYAQVRIYFILLGLFVVTAGVMQQYILAGVGLVLVGAGLTVYLLQKRNRKKEIQLFVQKVTKEQGGNEAAAYPFPVAMIRLVDDVVVYGNKHFCEMTGYADGMDEQTIGELVGGLQTDWLSAGKHEYTYDVTVKNRRYRVYGTSVRGDDPAGTLLGMLYFTDLTELYQIRDEYVRSRPVVSIILVDNYEELTKNLTEGAISSLDAKLNDAINQWTEGYHGLLRRLEKNRFLLVFENRDLRDAKENKFSVLEKVHQVTSPSGLAASLSFGIGVDSATFEEGFAFASLALEMALSRGGDQAVIKDRYNFSFYGGRTKEADRRSKVRSRVTANSLMELIGQSEHVFVMGHRNADLDSIGAAMGICCMCRKKGKKFNIVLDTEHNMAPRLIKEIRSIPEYKDVFVSGQDALLMCDNHSILVVVDTNRPDQVESRNLLEAISKVCVVDHHRRAADYINPVVVNLHEPYASSASELTTELMEYALEKADVLPIEAKSLLAGIFLDTKSFHMRTGERTFEAAAYLRQLGAEPVEVKKLLQNDFQDTVTKYQIIKSARLYRDEIAISIMDDTVSRVLASQAADELLNIAGISASFVVYPDGEQVIISARSIGSANVQVILEDLGGGGNAATAGTQMENVTVKDAVAQLVASIEKFYEE